LRYNADKNAKDLNGRTPLFLAAMLNKESSVRCLLANMSNAFSMDNEGNKIEDITENQEILKLIKTGKSVIIQFTFTYYIVLSCHEIYTSR
jgi:ankyrin repeat protein